MQSAEKANFFSRQRPVRSRPSPHDSTTKTAWADLSTYLLLFTALEAFSLVIVGNRRHFGMSCSIVPRDTHNSGESEVVALPPSSLHFRQVTALSNRFVTCLIDRQALFQDFRVFAVVSALKGLAKRRSACRRGHRLQCQDR